MKYIGESIRFTLDGTPPLREGLAAFLAEQHLMIGEFRALGSSSPEAGVRRSCCRPYAAAMTHIVALSTTNLSTDGKKDWT